MHRFFLAAALIVFASSANARAYPHEAYIWQRVWTPPVVDAAAKSADLFQGWRVLAAESDRSGRLVPFAVNWAALAGTKRPAIAVIRIDGRLAHWDGAALLGQIHALSAGWPVAGIEIDYDCGTARLTDYAAFLTALRKQARGRLSITALPAWLSSPALPGLLAATDEVVLQVHAVRAPDAALFDAHLARHWIGMLDRIDTKPFRVALPDYGTRIVRDTAGRVVAMQSEMPRLVGGASARELAAEPLDVSLLLQDLCHSPLAHLAGFVWFRLPVAGDVRIWSASTLRAVVLGERLEPHLAVLARHGMAKGAYDIVLTNDGEVDAMLPAFIDLPGNCSAADGINGYTLNTNGAGISLVRLNIGYLFAHHDQTVGWARCQPAPEAIHVRP